MNTYGIIFSSCKYHRCTVQNEIWMCVSVLCQRYTRYTGEITWKTTSKTTESTSQNNRLFLKTNPLLLLQKQKQELLQRQQRKLSRKKIFLLVRRTSRPERSFLFLDRMILIKRRMAVQEAFALERTNPSASRSFGTSPSRGGKGASRRACTLIWVLAEIRGYGRMLSSPTVRVGKLVTFNRDAPRITASILSRTIIGQIVPVHIVLSEFYPFNPTFLVNFSVK